MVLRMGGWEGGMLCRERGEVGRGGGGGGWGIEFGGWDRVVGFCFGVDF